MQADGSLPKICCAALLIYATCLPPAYTIMPHLYTNEHEKHAPQPNHIPRMPYHAHPEKHSIGPQSSQCFQHAMSMLRSDTNEHTHDHHSLQTYFHAANALVHTTTTHTTMMRQQHHQSPVQMNHATIHAIEHIHRRMNHGHTNTHFTQNAYGLAQHSRNAPHSLMACTTNIHQHAACSAHCPAHTARRFTATFFWIFPTWTSGYSAWSTTLHHSSLLHGYIATNYCYPSRAMVVWCLPWMITPKWLARTITQQFTTLSSRYENWYARITGPCFTHHIPTIHRDFNSTNYGYPSRAMVVWCLEWMIRPMGRIFPTGAASNAN